MLIVPLVFVSLVAGITSMQDSAKLGRISLKTIAIYLVTTAFAVSIGLLFGALFSPGEGMNMVASGTQEAKQAPSLVSIWSARCRPTRSPPLPKATSCRSSFSPSLWV